MIKAKVLIPLIALGIIATGATLWSTGIVKAQNNGNHNSMATKLAEKLGIDQSKVTDAMDQMQTERKVEMQTRMTTKLGEAVTAGTITEAQKTAILERQTEMQNKRETEREANAKWFTDNNLDQDTLKDLGVGMGGGMGGGGMKGHGPF